MPEELSQEKEFVYRIFKNQRLYQPFWRINLPAGFYLFKLQFIGRHIFRVMHSVSVVQRPVSVQEMVLICFIYRRTRHKIHRLYQHALDLISDDKIRKLIACSLFLIVRAQYKKAPGRSDRDFEYFEWLL